MTHRMEPISFAFKTLNVNGPVTVTVTDTELERELELNFMKTDVRVYFSNLFPLQSVSGGDKGVGCRLPKNKPNRKENSTRKSELVI